MDINSNKNLGEQPIAKIMTERGMKPHDLVVASAEQLSHKMVSRAAKGRRLTTKVQSKVQRALNKATGKNYSRRDLFNY